MSDEPRTLQEQCYGTCWAACERIEELEHALNAANNRIKRLESAGNLLKDRYILENENWDLQTVNDWNEAKESNP